MANNNSGKNEKDLVCSFCGKHQDEVERMIIGPGVNICSECIGLCHDLLSDKPDQPKSARPARGSASRAPVPPAAAGAFMPLQIHGDVTDADLEGLRVLFPGKTLHLAAALPEDPVALAEAARRLEGLLERGLADRIVVDGTSDGLAGAVRGCPRRRPENRTH